MKKFLCVIIPCFCPAILLAQAPATDIYDLVKKFMYDSTGYENVGDWAVGQPKKFPVKWKSDRIEMSNDTSVNFYRQGTADILIRGKKISNMGKPMVWNVMLKGPRMGYSSFSIVSSASGNLPAKITIDSLFGGKSYKARLLKSCDTKSLIGYNYYEVKIPKKDIVYIKISWLTVSGNTAYRIDGFDSWSQYKVKLDCR